MGRKRKPGGRPWRGPFTYDHLRQAVEALGFKKCTGDAGGTRHEQWEHPSGGGKVGLSKKWTGVKKGSVTFRGVAAQAGISQKRLLALLQDVKR
jgi:hypothetical protein